MGFHSRKVFAVWDDTHRRLHILMSTEVVNAGLSAEMLYAHVLVFYRRVTQNPNVFRPGSSQIDLAFG